MTLALSALSTRLIAPFGATFSAAGRSGDLMAVRRSALRGGRADAPAPDEEAPTEPGFSAPPRRRAPPEQLRRQDHRDERRDQRRDEHREALGADDRLRWPIRDGLGTMLGTALTASAAFLAMGVCAVIAAQFAPEPGDSPFERPQARAAVMTPLLDAPR